MNVKILLGPICSGKTTFAKKLQISDDYIRISQDDIKRMLYGKIINSNLIDSVIFQMIYNSMNMIIGTIDNVKVVIDGLPLNTKQLSQITSSFNNIEILLFNIDLFEANIRNKKRNKEQQIYIHPEEIKKYNDVYKTYIKSSEFQYVVSTNKCKLIEIGK